MGMFFNPGVSSAETVSTSRVCWRWCFFLSMVNPLEIWGTCRYYPCDDLCVGVPQANPRFSCYNSSIWNPFLNLFDWTVLNSPGFMTCWTVGPPQFAFPWPKMGLPVWSRPQGVCCPMSIWVGKQHQRGAKFGARLSTDSWISYESMMVFLLAKLNLFWGNLWIYRVCIQILGLISIYICIHHIIHICICIYIYTYKTFTHPSIVCLFGRSSILCQGFASGYWPSCCAAPKCLGFSCCLAMQ